MQKDLTVQNALKLDIELFGEPKNYDEERGYFNQPYSKHTGEISKAIRQGDTLTFTEEANGQLKLDFGTLSYTDNKGNHCILSIERIKGKDVGLMLKLFNIGLRGINDNCQLTKNGIEFFRISDDELIKRGVYKSKDALRKGIQAKINKLNKIGLNTDIEIDGYQKEGVPSIFSCFRCTDHNTKKKGIEFYLNPLIDEKTLMSLFIPTPTYIDSLLTNAYVLLNYICEQATINHSNVYDDGTFTLQIKGCIKRMGLKDNSGNKPREKLLQPLIDAINEIRETHKEKTAEEFSIKISGVKGTSLSNGKIVLVKDADTRAIIDKGYLKIILPKAIADEHIKHNQSIAEAKAKEQQRRENIQDKAIAMNKAKKMKRKEAEPKPQEEYTQTSIDDITII